MKLVLWRHGRTPWNDDGRFQGHADIALDSVGVAQAAAAAPSILAMNPDVVVSSDLVRCRSTASALGLPFRADERLREIDLGVWSGLTGDEAQARYPAELAAWRRGEDIRRGGGETYREVAARASAVVDELVEAGSVGPDGVALLVLHGGTARALCGALLGFPHDSWWRFGPLGNCRWTVLRRGSSGYRLVEHNVGVTGVPMQPATSPDVEPVHLPSRS